MPRRSQYAALLANATSGVPAVEPPEKQEAAEEALEHFIDYTDKYELSAKNIFKAHKQAIGMLHPFGHHALSLTLAFTL